MTVFLDRVDAAPLSNTNFTFEYMQWVSVLVDSLNEVLQEIQDNLNLNTSQSYTASQITALNVAGLPDGVILYDTDNNVYVGKENGALVQFDTSPYP